MILLGATILVCTRMMIQQSITHWGRVTHIWVSKLNIINSDNGLSFARCQAIVWTNAGILLIGPLWTNFSDMSIEIHIFSFKKIHMKMLSVKWQPFCLSLNVLNEIVTKIKQFSSMKMHLKQVINMPLSVKRAIVLLKPPLKCPMSLRIFSVWYTYFISKVQTERCQFIIT